MVHKTMHKNISQWGNESGKLHLEISLNIIRSVKKITGNAKCWQRCGTILTSTFLF